MKEKEFSNIFLKPLYKEKIHLNKIDTDIYDEILNLSDRFLISSHILNNLIYEKEEPNELIEGLKKQFNISNLKNLINKNEQIKIASLFSKNHIKHVFLKGLAINLLDEEYIRYSRDLDILVNKKSLPKAYELLKESGYKFLNPLVSDNTEFTKYSYHLPILSNDNGGLLEIHHRVTDRLIYKECPLTELILNEYTTVNKSDVNINIPNPNHQIAHIIYHAALHHKFEIGPVFLYDINFLKNKINNKKDLENLLLRMNLEEIYTNIIEFINSKRISDSFNLYKISNLKDEKKRKSNGFLYLFFTKKGRLELLNIILKKFTKNEDLYQTSKFSLKFYIILLIELKNYCFKQIKK